MTWQVNRLIPVTTASEMAVSPRDGRRLPAAAWDTTTVAASHAALP